MGHSTWYSRVDSSNPISDQLFKALNLFSLRLWIVSNSSTHRSILTSKIKAKYKRTKPLHMQDHDIYIANVLVMHCFFKPSRYPPYGVHRRTSSDLSTRSLTSGKTASGHRGKALVVVQYGLVSLSKLPPTKWCQKTVSHEKFRIGQTTQRDNRQKTRWIKTPHMHT